jgi:hypothetical protein
MHCVMKTFLAASFAIALLAQFPARASDSGLGWLIYEQPSTDPHYGAIPGQARPIFAAYLRSGNAKIVDVVDQAGDDVPVHFFWKSSAATFLAAVQGGATYDITGCAHESDVHGTPYAGDSGCTITPVQAAFHCDLADPVKQAGVPAMDPALPVHFINPPTLSVYLENSSCPQMM